MCVCVYETSLFGVFEHEGRGGQQIQLKLDGMQDGKCVRVLLQDKDHLAVGG